MGHEGEGAIGANAGTPLHACEVYYIGEDDELLSGGWTLVDGPSLEANDSGEPRVLAS